MTHPHAAVVKLPLLILCCAALLSTSSGLPAHAAESVPESGALNRPRAKPNVKAWNKNREAGRQAQNKGDAQEAEAFYRAAVEEAENFGPADYRLAASLEDLGSLHAATENLAAAEP